MADVTVLGWDNLFGKMFDMRRQTCESDLMLGDYAFTQNAVAVLREKLAPTLTPLPEDEQKVLDEHRAEKKEREAVAAAEARINAVMAKGLLEIANFPIEMGIGRWSGLWAYYLKAKGSSCLTPDGYFHSPIKSEAAEAAAKWAEELKPEVVFDVDEMSFDQCRKYLCGRGYQLVTKCGLLQWRWGCSQRAFTIQMTDETPLQFHRRTLSAILRCKESG